MRSNSLGSTSSEASSLLGVGSSQNRVRNPRYTPSRPYAQVSSPSGDGSNTTVGAGVSSHSTVVTTGISGVSGNSSRSSCTTQQYKQLQKFQSDSTTNASSASQIYIQTTSRDLKTRSHQTMTQQQNGGSTSHTTTGSSSSGTGSGSQSDHESERRTEALNNRLGAFKRNASFSHTQSAVEISPQMLLDGRIKEMPVTHTLTGTTFDLCSH